MGRHSVNQFARINTNNQYRSKRYKMKHICFFLFILSFIPQYSFSQSKKEIITNLSQSLDSVSNLLSNERLENQREMLSLENKVNSLSAEIQKEKLQFENKTNLLLISKDSLKQILTATESNVKDLTDKISILENEYLSINLIHEEKIKELRIASDKLSSIQSSYELLLKKVKCDSLMTSYKSIWTGSDSLILLPHEKYITARYDGYGCSEVCVFQFSDIKSCFISSQCKLCFYDQQIISFYSGVNDFQSISELYSNQNESAITARKVELKIVNNITQLIPGKYYQMIITECNDPELLSQHNVNDWSPGDEALGANVIIGINELNQAFDQRILNK
jgi:hypothetical protein